MQYRASLAASSVANATLPDFFLDAFCGEVQPQDLIVRDGDKDAQVAHRLWSILRDKSIDETCVVAETDPVIAVTRLFVVLPDKPFITDSVLMDLTQQDLAIGFLVNLTLNIPRDSQGRVSESEVTERQSRDTLIYCELDPLTSIECEQLSSRVSEALRDVAAAVNDYAAMKTQVQAQITALEQFPSREEATRAREFLIWLLDDHFTFLGCRNFSYLNGEVRQIADSELGIMRFRPPSSVRAIADMPLSSQAFLTERRCLSFSKSGTRSRVHRPAYPDYIGIKAFDENGDVVGEFGIYGLYTSPVYTDHPRSIPFLRDKTEEVLQRADLDPAGFDGKNLAQILTTYPRNELFQIEADDLYRTALAVAQIHERRTTRLFVRRARYGLFYTCLVYVPREVYNTRLRLALDRLFTEKFGALDIEFDAWFSESILVRLEFSLRVDPEAEIDVNIAELEEEVVRLAQDWHHTLKRNLRAKGELHELQTLFDSLPHDYDDSHSPELAQSDLNNIAQLSGTEPTRVLLQERGEEMLLRFFCHGRSLTLAEIVPILEQFGFVVNGERTFKFRDHQNSVHEYTISHPALANAAAAPHKALQEALSGILGGTITADGFNQLIITSAGNLGWREVKIVRAYAAYMKQVEFGFDQQFIIATLNNHIGVTQYLVGYFLQRFNPDSKETSSPDVTQLLQEVDLLNEDRALRKFFQLVSATVRTNYFQEKDGKLPKHLAFKIEPARIEGLPKPIPAIEVFVFGPDVEGVHLRSSRVARGGIRWSDRSEDYRTEVLDLMSTQVVKNALIVPSGAKGGFLVRNPERSGLDCYRTFVGCLLDITDNIVDGNVVPPERVRRYDGDDTYFVVAADKGTATFSDEANVLSQQRGYWLADAFASGGATGYDHKKMGITARGAWVSVVHHLQRRGVDPQVDPISVIGIGDMSGDVFGNGLLSSSSLLLIGAFNHRHIFLDPNPDANVSFAERQRLFVERLGWNGYDQGLISAGGGIFERTMKAIPITREVAERLDLPVGELPPDKLISAILSAPVDLVWNGGVGTYVKASFERHTDVGDRANDSVRIDATALRASTVGEGGNLGMTQAARVEFALGGGAINGDFIDNSGGVDCSDHEVNLKILLNTEVSAGRLSVPDRDKLLRHHEDDVAALVLANNASQALALTLAEHQSNSYPEAYARLLDQLENDGLVDRELQALPSKDELSDRLGNGEGLTRPELAILMCSTKIWLKQELVKGSSLDAAIQIAALEAEFPIDIAEQYNQGLTQHPLAMEIAATIICNQLVDRLGIILVPWLKEFSSADIGDILLAILTAQKISGFDAAWTSVLSSGASIDHQTGTLLGLAQSIGRAARWILRRQSHGVKLDEMTTETTVYAEGAKGNVTTMLCIAELALAVSISTDRITKAWEDIDQSYRFTLLIQGIQTIPNGGHWQVMERDALLDDVLELKLRLTEKWLTSSASPEWGADNERFHARWNQIVDSYLSGDHMDSALAALTVRKLDDLSKV